MKVFEKCREIVLFASVVFFGSLPMLMPNLVMAHASIKPLAVKGSSKSISLNGARSQIIFSKDFGRPVSDSDIVSVLQSQEFCDSFFEYAEETDLTDASQPNFSTWEEFSWQYHYVQHGHVNHQPKKAVPLLIVFGFGALLVGGYTTTQIITAAVGSVVIVAVIALVYFTLEELLSDTYDLKQDLLDLISECWDYISSHPHQLNEELWDMIDAAEETIRQIDEFIDDMLPFFL